jgi:hypothetical protein
MEEARLSPLPEKGDRVIRLLVESDYHCGHILGLTPPDYWTVASRKFAKPVWDWRKDMISRIGKIDIHVLNGDLTDGPGRKETIGLFTTDVKVQADIAATCAMMVESSNKFLTYGTPFHTVSTLSHEELVASALGCEIFETLRIKAGGVRFNYRHVVGRSDVPYGQGTQLYKETVRDQLQGLIEEYQDADVIGRAHTHYFWHEETATKHAFINPCWELPNPDKDGNIYARKLRTMYYSMGAVLIEVDKGEVIIRKQIMPLKIAIKREYIECLEK